MSQKKNQKFDFDRLYIKSYIKQLLRANLKMINYKFPDKISPKVYMHKIALQAYQLAAKRKNLKFIFKKLGGVEIDDKYQVILSKQQLSTFKFTANYIKRIKLPPIVKFRKSHETHYVLISI